MRKRGRFAHVRGDEIDSEGLAERNGRGGRGEEHGAEGEVLLEETEGLERVFDGARSGCELVADAENEAIRRRRRRRRRVSGRDEEGTGIEFGCVEDREIPWRERKKGRGST